MNAFHKLPFLLSASMAVLVGVISILLETDNQTVYLRMVITMVVFYIIGKYTGKTLDKLKIEIAEKNAEAERESKLIEDIEAKQDAEKNLEPFKGQNINLSAEGQDDEFEPLTVSRVIANKINQ